MQDPILQVNRVNNRNPFFIFFFLCIVSAILVSDADADISFAESTQEAGLTYTGPTFGAQWADYNGDGWPDIWVTNHESKEPSLYLNMGDGTFEQISDSIWDQMPWSQHDSHGAGWADIDNDGDQDVLVSGGTHEHENFLFVNDNGILYERAEEYGLSFTENRGRMPLWFDFDNDGLLDVYLNGIVPPYIEPAALFRQNTETGLFENVNSLAGFTDHSTVFSMLSDLTNDGVMDIITYDDGPQFPTYVFSMSTIPFTDERDIIFPPIMYTGYAHDAAFADFNGDLLPDLYLAKSGGDEEAIQVTSAKLAISIPENTCECEKGISFKSNGTLNILFSVLFHQVEDHPIYIGSSAYPAENFEGDIDPDDPRIWGMWPQKLFYLELNPNDSRVYGMPSYVSGDDNGVFIGFDEVSETWTIVSSQSLDKTFWCKFIVESDSQITDFTPLNINLNPLTPPIDRLYIHNGVNLESRSPQQTGINQNLPGRSVVAGDFDNDMDIDIYVLNSFRGFNISNILLENDGTGFFTEVPSAGGAEGTSLGSGNHVVTADYNRDGFLDLFLANGQFPSPFDHGGPIQLFKNNGNSNHWIEIDLVGTISNRDGIGARVLMTAGGKTQLREQGGGMHKFSQNHTRIHFGLGQNTTIERLEVRWPSGIVQVIENIPADQILLVRESSGAPQPPVAVDDYADTDMDTATTVDVLVNDYDPNADTLTIVAVENPTDQGGLASIKDNGSPDDPADDFIDYTPPSGFSGSDTFTYTIDDYSDGTGTATVTVTVNGATPDCSSYGEPNYDPATEDGVFLWKEGNVWRLRAVAGLSGWQRYIGSIVSDMDPVNVSPVNFEEQWGDSLDTFDPQMITFDMSMSGPWYDGLDFEYPAGAVVSFDVQARTGNAVDLVFIGGDRCPVDQLPYQLPTDSNTLPVASFTTDSTVEDPLEMNFDASLSYDADGSIISYAWNYGDGSTGSGITSSHIYSTAGIYIVSLTVTDSDGSTDTASQTITIGDLVECTPDGEPSYDPASEDGVFLWKEGNVWHVRAVAGLSGWQRYIGSMVSDMPPLSVTPVSFEEEWGDILDISDPQTITFNMNMSGPWYDGLDIEFPAGATVTFDTEVTTGNTVDLVFIGGDRCTVTQLPYQLP